MSEYHKDLKFPTAVVRRSWQAYVDAEPTCHLCGRPILRGEQWHVDHIVPLADGGAPGRENQHPAHASCNMRASALRSQTMVARRRRWV